MFYLPEKVDARYVRESFDNLGNISIMFVEIAYLVN
jgi:hypothetical protein